MRRNWPALLAAVAGAAIVVSLASVIPVEVRHTAPFGFRQTLDRSRGIAVDGVSVTANYPNFNRLDLDLRAYSPAEEYDLTVVVRPEEEDAEPVRTVRFHALYDDIAVDKTALGNPFTTVRFSPIVGSEGQTYYVSVERGPRNQDDILALWSVKSYSRVRGITALSAFVDQFPGAGPRWLTWIAFGALMIIIIVSLAALLYVLGGWAWREAWQPGPSAREVALSESRG